MAPPILNKDYYYVLKQRMLRFNNRYKDRLMIKGDHRLTEDVFDTFYESWKTVAQEHANDLDVKDVPVNEVISEELFEQFLQGAKSLSDSLSNLAYNLDLGEVYFEHDKEHRDYTYLSQEIFEICMLAAYTYTNFFQQCKYIKDYGIEPATGSRRAKEMAKVLYPDAWHTFEIPLESQQLLDNPLLPFKFEIDKGVYRDENTYQLHTEPKDRKPYEKVKRENDRIRAQRINKLDQEREQKKIDAENAIKQGFIDSENQRIINEKRHNPEMGDYSVYGTFRDVLPKVRNYEEPGAQYEHFYALFKQKLDIPEDVLSAQTLIYAMQEIKHEGSFNEPFVDQIMPVYRQLQCVAFETAAKRCIENNIPIDFNDVSRKIDEVMAALYCTTEPLAFQRGDEEARITAAEIMNGTLSRRTASHFNEWLRAGAINQVREEYRAKGNAAFNQNAEAIFNSYTELAMSSKQIAMNARNAAAGYEQYREAIDSGKMQSDAFEQATMRATFMDKAYALEQRIETRYASGWSKFIRMISYNRQVNALAVMKEALGINPDTRVADVYLQDRLDNVVKDFSNIKEVNNGRRMFTKTREDSVTEHVRNMMKNALDGKELPHQEDWSEAIRKYEESGVNDDTVNGRLRKQELEEEKRRRQEEEERKRLEKEELDRKQEEERLKRVAEEEEREKQLKLEEEIRKAKEEVYLEQLDTKQIKVQNLKEELDKIAKEDQKKWDEYRVKAAEYAQKLQDMIKQEEQHNYNISLLKQYEKEAAELNVKLNLEIQNLVNQAVPEKKMEAVKKQARKNAEKHIAGGQALKDGEKISAKIENNDAIRSMTQDLSELNLKIVNQKNLVDRYNLKRAEFGREKERYEGMVGVSSQDWKDAHKALKAAEEDYNNFKNNKEKILETCEGLGFSLKEFMRRDDPNARNSAFISIRPMDDNDVRFTVVRDSDVSDDNVAIEPPVSDEGRHAVNGLSKNI